MLSEYKKTIKITNVSTTTGILKYEFLYNTQISDISEEVERIENTIKIVDRVPTTGDKMYFLNGVTVPRFKIKKFCEEKGPRVVKYIESGNLAIIGKNTIKEHFITNCYYELDQDEIINYLYEWIVENKDEDSNSDHLAWAYKMITDIKQLDTGVFIGTDYNHKNYLEKTKGISFTSDNYNSIREMSLDSYNRLQKILNLTYDVIDESTILKQLNTTVLMDKEVYESIQRLMDSSDLENLKLAMELMSNCDYDNSAMYLLLLLKKYSTKIYNIHTKNHVNFKAMLNYFGFTPSSNFNIDVDEIIEILKERKLLVTSQLNILVPLILKDYNPESEHYRASSVTFIDKDGNDIIIDDSPKIEPEDEPEDEMELDPIIYDELTEVAEYCRANNLLEFTATIQRVTCMVSPPSELLPIIEYLDETGAYEQSTLLIQSYLSIP